MITYEKIEGGFKAFYHNGIFMGEILMDVDGFYKWWGKHRQGYQLAIDMRTIADKMDALNKEFEEELIKALGEVSGTA